jgi:hypothetical protein
LILTITAASVVGFGVLARLHGLREWVTAALATIGWFVASLAAAFLLLP